MSAEPTLAAVAQALQDAAQLAGRYGSTSAARERLESLEREHEGLGDMVALLRSRLRQTQRSAAAAEAEVRRLKTALLSASGGPGFDAERFVDFLKRRFACRGDLALLLDALVEFQTSPSDAGAQPSERVVVLTIEEVQTTLPSPSTGSTSARLEAAAAAYSTPSTAVSSSSSLSVKLNGAAAASSAYGSIGIGVHHKYYQHQSPEEEEQEIHLAAKQLLSPVTFARVEEDDDDGRTDAAAALNPFVPIHHSTDRSERAMSPSGTSFIRAKKTPEDGGFQKILPKKPKVKKSARAPSPQSTKGHHTMPAPTTPTAPSDDPLKQPLAKKRKVIMDENLVIKQNLVWPSERRNISDLKLSSRFLSLKTLESLDRQTPWNEMYKRRPLHSHVVNYSELDERAKVWFITTLKIQFVWRRELWERLHWLPMSESVCTGAAWDRYRQTRKRRAKHAVTAWRKVYADSIHMIETGLLPDDIWCDPALWYMPANPIYWLPDSEDVIAELELIDEKHPVRSYHVFDMSRHPFYALGLVNKYPTKYDLPSFSSIAVHHSVGGGVGTTEEDLATFAMKDHLLAELVRPSQQQAVDTSDPSAPLAPDRLKEEELPPPPQSSEVVRLQEREEAGSVVVSGSEASVTVVAAAEYQRMEAVESTPSSTGS